MSAAVVNVNGKVPIECKTTISSLGCEMGNLKIVDLKSLLVIIYACWSIGSIKNASASLRLSEYLNLISFHIGTVIDLDGQLD